jgi:hypothetical protein
MPTKVIKDFCSATSLSGSAALPFVIPTGAPKERSGGTCGCFDLERNCHLGAGAFC